ncbi:MAG: hypothetical protein QGH27_10605, partial [SAR324 cluster bacterium]|nr:hypothetical protein [SAR324 cluster bacterium]
MQSLTALNILHETFDVRFCIFCELKYTTICFNHSHQNKQLSTLKEYPWLIAGPTQSFIRQWMT